MGFSDAPQIERGLAQYEWDHFAILGVPLTADAKQVSDCYKRVAKALRAGFVGNSEEAEQAGALFAKWVNPAKEILSKQAERAEYETLLQLHVRRLLNSESDSPEKIWPKSEICQPLRHSSSWESDYQKQVAQIAEEQYKILDQVVEKTSQLSELNLAYLLLKSGAIRSPSPPKSSAAGPAAAPSTPSGASPASATGSSPSLTSRPFEPSRIDSPPVRRTSSQPVPAPRQRVDPSETRYKQAVEMIERGQYKEAVKFLGFAIDENPQPEYYLRRAEAYMNMGSKGMARADYQQVLRLDPTHQEAKKGLRQTSPTVETASAQGGNKQKPPASDKGSGGFLGRLFGKK